MGTIELPEVQTFAMPGCVPAVSAISMQDVQDLGRAIYLWGWPLVNVANRARNVRAVAGNRPVVEGDMPLAYGHLAMLTDYIDPDERAICCTNRDVVYGGGVFQLDESAVVVQIPDFGERFWSLAFYDARTDECLALGKQHRTAPGFYLVAGPGWDGIVPPGVKQLLPAPTTKLVIGIGRVFTKNTPEDLAAVKQVLPGLNAYPLAEFDGNPISMSWDDIERLPRCWLPGRRKELQFVKPEHFLSDLRTVLRTVPQADGEDAIYQNIRDLLWAADNDRRIKRALRETFLEAERDVIAPLMQWRQNGVSTCNNWNTSANSGDWKHDYWNRAATAKSNIFESKPDATRYFYTDVDLDGDVLSGETNYEIRFTTPPPVTGFWSISLYDRFHFFETDESYPPNYSLGTKDTSLKYNSDGSLTLYAGPTSPGVGNETNWLPSPYPEMFCLYIRAYGPDGGLLDGHWSPPLVTPRSE